MSSTTSCSVFKLSLHLYCQILYFSLRDMWNPYQPKVLTDNITQYTNKSSPITLHSTTKGPYWQHYTICPQIYTGNITQYSQRAFLTTLHSTPTDPYWQHYTVHLLVLTDNITQCTHRSLLTILHSTPTSPYWQHYIVPP